MKYKDEVLSLLLLEQSTLELKIDNLSKFLNSEDFNSLLGTDQEWLLNQQLEVMLSYDDILKARIADLKKK